MLEAALRYAELGYRVFPCVPGDSKPLTENGFHNATTDAVQIERWWQKCPNANVGIATEGLLVVDVDPLDGGETNTWLRDDPERQLDLAAAPTSVTPRGGRHHVFRKSAGKGWRCTVSGLAPHVDTRTDGGYIVVAPSRRPEGPYAWLPGLELDVPPDRLPEPPAWLAAELDGLAARGLTSARAAAGGDGANEIPSGRRNSTLASLGGTMRRVGMSQAEILAALRQTNADRCVPPLDEREVEKIAWSIARYEPDQVSVAVAEDHWSQVCGDDEPPPERVDPGPLPDELFNVPGFMGEVMNFTLKRAPYPNVGLAFCGALAMQSYLCGRKVCDPGDLRANLYLLALAHSGVGKDFPRKVNNRILREIGQIAALGEKFASGEAIQDVLLANGAMLFQTDEFDGVLRMITSDRENKHESIPNILMTLYTSASTVYKVRAKARDRSAEHIDQPFLTLYATATPQDFYEALSPRLLRNGFFARLIIVDVGTRGDWQPPGQIRCLPESILQQALWWSRFNPTPTQNIAAMGVHPDPKIVHCTPEADAAWLELQRMADAEYNQAHARNDEVSRVAWSRTLENAKKLALIHACSANHENPVIDLPAVDWARRFAMHQTRRQLYLAQLYVAENPFHAECLKLLRKLKEAGGQMTRNKLMRAMHCKLADFEQIITTLRAQGEIDRADVPTRTKTAEGYKLLVP